MSEIQKGARVPSRALRDRPSVQSAALLIPLTEIVGGGKDLGKRRIRRTEEVIYTSIGAGGRCASTREMPGHVANRLQAALRPRGFINLVAEGVVSAADVDTALVLGGRACAGGVMGSLMLNQSRRWSGRHRALLPAVSPAR